MYVMYNWVLWSDAVIRTERAFVMDLPRGLKLDAYLCRVNMHWWVFLRVNNVWGRLVFPVWESSFDVLHGDTWAEARKHAKVRIAEWLASQDKDRVKARAASEVAAALACQSC